MAHDRLRVSAVVTVEEWSDDGGYLVRALVRSGETGREIIGPAFAASPAEARQTLLQLCDVLVALIQKGL
jgi:hypothetical protein